MSPEQKFEFSHVQTTILRVVAELTRGFFGKADLTPVEQFVEELHTRYGRDIGEVTSTVNIYNQLVLDDKVLVIGGCFVDEVNEGTDKDTSWYHEVVRVSTELVASYALQADVDVLAGDTDLDVMRELIAEVQDVVVGEGDSDYSPEDVESAAEAFLTAFHNRAKLQRVEDPDNILNASVGEFEVDIIVRKHEITAVTFGSAQIVKWSRGQGAAK